MSILLNAGYHFKIDDSLHPSGGVILGGTITKHALQKRGLKAYKYLGRRYFDPQLYMAEMDPNQSPNYCANLATYAWFGITELEKYDTGKQTQGEWKQDAVDVIGNYWMSAAPSPKTAPALVEKLVAECIEFQIKLGCEGIILPGPLTHDAATDYSDEIFWLDAGLAYAKERGYSQPTYATIALVDSCLRYVDPTVNPLLSLILDAVGARETNGVYLVVEQASEPNETKYLSNTRVLWSALHMTYTLKHDCGKQLLVNFFGPYGLVLEAAGADMWATQWYKSMQRFRLADKIGGGPSYPSYWSMVALADVNLDSDFDNLANMGQIEKIADATPFSTGLLKAAAASTPVAKLPSWRYSANNRGAAMDHYLYSVIRAEAEHSKDHGTARLNRVEDWLSTAVNRSGEIIGALGPLAKTKTGHIQSWLDAFRQFRRSQNI